MIVCIGCLPVKVAQALALVAEARHAKNASSLGGEGHAHAGYSTIDFIRPTDCLPKFTVRSEPISKSVVLAQSARFA